MVLTAKGVPLSTPKEAPDEPVRLPVPAIRELLPVLRKLYPERDVRTLVVAGNHADALKAAVTLDFLDQLEELANEQDVHDAAEHANRSLGDP